MPTAETLEVSQNSQGLGNKALDLIVNGPFMTRSGWAFVYSRILELLLFI